MTRGPRYLALAAKRAGFTFPLAFSIALFALSGGAVTASAQNDLRPALDGEGEQLARTSLPQNIPAEVNTPVVMIYDLSGSMWGEIDGEIKHHAARDVVGTVLEDLGQRADLGLVAYGHRRQADCSDIEAVVPLGDSRVVQRTQQFLASAIPTGRTPLTAALETAGQELVNSRGSRNTGAILLLTDGEESCKGDPCALAQSWLTDGGAPEVHVVGFGMSDADVAPLACLAELTGGSLSTAGDASALSRAMSRVAARAETKGLREQVRAMAQMMSGLEADLALANQRLQSSETTQVETERALKGALNREVELKHESRDLWARLSDSNVQIDRLENSIVALNQELADEREQRDALQVRLDQAQQTERKLLAEKEVLLLQLSSLRADFDQQLEELARLGDQMDDLTGKHTLALLERDRVREMLVKQERDAKAARLVAQKAVFSAQESDAKRAEAMAESKVARLDRLEAERLQRMLQKQVDDATIETVEADVLLQQAAQEREKLELELRAREDELKAAAEEAKRAQAIAEETEERNRKLKQEMDQTETTIQAIHRESVRVKARLQQRETRLSQLTETSERRENEIQRLLRTLRSRGE